MPKSVTLKDVAAKVGVTSAAASMALSGHERISEKTRAAVKQAADELGYVPSSAGRALRSQRAAALALVHTGCSAGGAASSDGPVTLKVWTGFTGGDRPGYATIVKDFEKSHPKIKVDMTVQPWDTIQQKLPSAWLTGQGPDVAAVSSDPNAVAQYVKTNSVLPITMTGSGDGKINTSEFAPGTVEEFTYDGKLYGVPANFATLSLYYNKKLFADAGIANPPTTVQEMAADAKKLTTGGGYGIALADNQTIQMWPVLQWLEGGDIVTSKGCSAVQTTASQQGLSTWA
ncbi:extracellular solute-binding protein, partial [Xanthomonas citri pv. citri]